MEDSDHQQIRRCFALLLLVHAAMLAYAAWIHGPGWDEGGHLPSGISHWQHGNTDAYRVNPPLVRMLATLPLAMVDFDVVLFQSDDTRVRPEWGMGHLFWQQQGRDAYWYLTIARWACIPWSLLAAYIIYIWGDQLYGRPAGLLAAVLWCFSPLVLTNAQMITPDTGAAALGVAASFAFWKYLNEFTWSRAIDAGILLGLAELAKFTWIVLFALWPALWTLKLYLNRRKLIKWQLRDRLLQFLLIILLAIGVINAGYGFEGTMQRLGAYRFVSSSLTIDVHGEGAANRFSGTLLGAVPIPLPSNYVLGIDRQKLDFESGYRSYLHGVWQDHGWWYYYLYGLLVKEPIGYLLIFCASMGYGLRRVWNWDSACLILPAGIVFVLVSSQTGFNHHLRYVLPCLPFVFIWMGQFWHWAVVNSVRKWGVLAILASSIFASVYVFPHSHAYFNAFAGGPMRGHNHLLDSNIDWGQDILLLADWIESHPEKPIDGVAYSLDWLISREALGITSEKPPRGLRVQSSESTDRGKFGPQPGRYAVFVRPLREDTMEYDYFRYFKPVEVLGYTVYIYELNQQDVSRYWELQDDHR